MKLYSAVNFNADPVIPSTMIQNIEQVAWSLGHLLITNDEVDMTVWQRVGYTNVVSVPNGQNADTRYMDPYLEVIRGMCEAGGTVCFATYGKHSGPTNRALSLRIGPEYCKVIQLPDTGAGSVYLSEDGHNKLIRMAQEAKYMPIHGVLSIEDIHAEVLQYLVHGYPDTLELDIPFLCNNWSVYLPEVTIIYGTPGSGKSTLADNILVSLAERHGIRSAIASMEKTPALHAVGMAKKRWASSEATPDEWMSAIEWLDEHFNYLLGEGGKDAAPKFYLEDVLAKARALVRTRGIRALLIDNWSCLMDRKERNEDDAQFVARILSELTGFAKRYSCHVFMVMHPRKLEPSTENPSFYKTPGLYDMLGSSMAANLTDNAIVINKLDYDGRAEIAIRKVRNQEFVGTPSTGEVMFSEADGGTYKNYEPAPVGTPSKGSNFGFDLGKMIDEASAHSTVINRRVDIDAEIEF